MYIFIGINSLFFLKFFFLKAKIKRCEKKTTLSFSPILESCTNPEVEKKFYPC